MFRSLSVIEKFILTYVSILSLLGVFLAIFNQPYFDSSYSIEDGLIEWLQFIGLTTISYLCLDRFFRLRYEKSVYFLGLTLFVGLFFFFASGEEISWGQRLLGIESSDFFKQNNLQHETNLHNLVVGKTKINKLIFSTGLTLVFAIYLGVISPLYSRSAFVKKWVNFLGIPIPQLYQTIGYILVIVLVEGLVKIFSDTGRRGELTEFAAIYLVMLNVAFPRNAEIFKSQKLVDKQ